MEKLYDYHFRAYRQVSNEFLGEFHWKQITAKEFNRRLARIYSKNNVLPIVPESDVVLNWL